MPRVLSRCFIVLVVFGALMFCASSGRTWAAGAPPTPDDKAVVVGGIDPCEGIPVHDAPKYAAGTVTVLKGRITWKRIDSQDKRMVFPTDGPDPALVT